MLAKPSLFMLPLVLFQSSGWFEVFQAYRSLSKSIHLQVYYNHLVQFWSIVKCNLSILGAAQTKFHHLSRYEMSHHWCINLKPKRKAFELICVTICRANSILVCKGTVGALAALVMIKCKANTSRGLIRLLIKTSGVGCKQMCPQT